MAQRSRFFDSTAGDRIYGSDAWAQVLRGLASDGLAETGDLLNVLEASPPSMNVRVNTGVMFIQGHYFEVHTGMETLAIAAAHATNPRIDRVVVRRSLANRTASLIVLTGTPAASPTPPAVTQSVGGTYEISLAQVLVPASSTSVINSRITQEAPYADSPVGTHALTARDDAIEAIETAIGQDYGARVRANRSGNQAIPDSSDTAIAWNEADTVDSHDFHDTASQNSRITIPSGLGGVYSMAATVVLAAGVGARTVKIRRSGAETMAADGFGGLPSNTQYITVSTIAFLSGGDYLEVTVYQSSGGSLNVTDGTFTVIKIA